MNPHKPTTKGSKPIITDVPPVEDMEEGVEMESMVESPLDSVTQIVDGLTPEDLTTLAAYVNEKLNSQKEQPEEEEVAVEEEV